MFGATRMLPSPLAHQIKQSQSMPLQTVEPRRLYRKIADQISVLISAGEYTPGARLPPERDLAKQLGVSRPSVREALIALEVEGLLDVRVGSGIYVTDPANGASAHALQGDAGPFDVISARALIEGECAALAAKAASPAQRRRDTRGPRQRDQGKPARSQPAGRGPAVPCADSRGERQQRAGARDADPVGPAHGAAIPQPRAQNRIPKNGG